jgi:SH3 domain protein
MMRQIVIMSIRSFTRRSIAFFAMIFVLPSAFGETVWVSDQFEVMLRTGPSTSNAIERMLSSGTELELIEEDAEAGYSRVMTRAGTEGWVLSRYLMSEPAAREQLATLTQQLTDASAEGVSMGSQLETIRSEHEAAKSRIAELEQDKADMQAEIDKIRRTAANVLAIDKQNMNLQQQLTDAEITVSILEQENDQLASRTTRNWFITGALVLFGGVLLGLLLPRLSWSRRSRYDRF